MRRSAVVILATLAALASQRTSATCVSSIAFGQASLNCGGYYCYVRSPGLDTSASILGTFWSLTFGDPSTGSGDDNGTLDDSSWLPSAGGTNRTLSGNWSSAGVDGCIANGPNALDNKMVVSLSDVDATGTVAYFAVVCNTRHPLNNPQFDQSDLVPHSHIDLKTIAAPSIASTTAVGNEAQVTVSSPSYASIFYSDATAGCLIGGVIKQYDVWIKQVARNAPAPGDRNQGTGGWTLGNTCNIGSNCVVTTTCGTTPCDAYLAESPRYDSGFQTGDAPGKARVGPSSTRVQAGLLYAGTVPDGAPGTPLTISKGSPPQLALTWGASCSAGATDYEVYEGMLGSFASHVPILCTTGGATNVTITPSSGNTYYLIVPATSSTEGSYGKTSAGAERPVSASACRVQNLGSCP